MDDADQFHVVLHQPVIPQNTGSIARLCACTGAVLHLIHPLGFNTDDASVLRAGLDYWKHVRIFEHGGWKEYLDDQKPERLVFLTKLASRSIFDARLVPPVHLVFGGETTGLPQELHRDHHQNLFKIPMRTHLVRSLNLAQAAAVVLYEALRQNGYSAGR